MQNDSERWLQAQDLATDGRWVLAMRQNPSQLVCFSGGTRAQVSLGGKPEKIRDMAGRAWQGWEWSDGRLTLHHTATVAATCLNVVSHET